MGGNVSYLWQPRRISSQDFIKILNCDNACMAKGGAYA